MNYREIVNYGLSFFVDDSLENDILTEFDWYLEDISGKKKIDIISSNFEFSENHKKLFEKFIIKRKKNIPYSYITGIKDFFGLEFYVCKDVLIPRNETEILVEKILEFSKDKSIIDMCTGSGCIAICIAKFGNPKKIIATDISYNAIKIAKKNANNLLSNDKLKNIAFVNCDKLNSINYKFDIFVSNPPYIRSNDILKLEEKVKQNEPLIALDGGNDGFYFYKYLSKNIVNNLKKGGKLFLEIGFDQGDIVKNLFEQNFESIKIIKDYANHDRFIYGENYLND
ncbi:MAG: peptide chain release factor N(5)-glutamine methyltransferase [Candidatus Muirbacterium halophilum]|nr:peptide chain release factor N(5)-glutamine methyltransferase [Candidatus Muirbacterium halophilum]MCK9477241.1 peptide chain release factor N(5)-glutamine methyltransferase [Candidatus Muirbacterium halophilum]